MAQFVNMHKVELSNGVAPVVSLRQIFYGDVAANRIGAIVLMNGAPVTLGGTCSGTAILADGSTVALTGTVSGNEAYVVLSSGCYSMEGQIQVFVKLTVSGVTTTLLAAVGTVRLTETDRIIDPGTIIPSVSALITSIEDAIAAIPADYSALLGSIAHTFSTSTAYTAGQYVWYEGELYRFNTAHPAGTWIGTDAARYTATDELPLIQQALGTKADAAEVEDVKNALIAYQTATDLGATIFKGEIIRVTGKKEANAKYARTNLRINSPWRIAINMASSVYEYAIFYYDDTGDLSTGAGYITFNGGYVQGYTILEKGNAAYLALSIRRADQSNISDADVQAIAAALQYYITTDKTLSEEGKPADAKAVGDAIAAINAEKTARVNEFITQAQSQMKSKKFAVNSGSETISFVSSTNRICAEEPFTVDYPLYLEAASGYGLSILVMSAATQNVADIEISSGWVPYFTVPKNTPFYLEVRKNTDANISTSEFASAVSSRVADANPGKTVDLMLFAGQSNMAGRGVTSSQWAEAAPTIIPGAGYEFRAISNPRYLVPIAEPFGVNENTSAGINDGSAKTGSMVTAFANSYYTHNGGVPIVGVSASKGGSGIDEWQPGQPLYADAVSRLNAAKAWLFAKGFVIRHLFLAWCQGEHEGATASADDDNGYITSFETMFAGFKSNGIQKCLLCRIGESNKAGEDYSIVIQKQTELTKTNADVVMVTTVLAGFKARGLMKDDYHYYQAAYNEMGRYAGVNAAIYVCSGKEPTMYDPKYSDLYYSEKN